jgi:hypothetical protein
VEAPYRNVQRSAVASIKRMCKIVNQTMLLQNLNDTRVCDQLLEQEANEDIRKSGPGMSWKSSIFIFKPPWNEMFTRKSGCEIII